MSNLAGFIRRERLYILLITFIAILNIAVFAGTRQSLEKSSEGYVAGPPIKVETFDAEALGAARESEAAAKRAAVEKVFEARPRLALVLGVVSLLAIAIFLLGVVIDFIFLASVFRRRKLNIDSIKPKIVGWGVWDVAKVIILFLFFGYIIIIVESFFARVFPILKNDSFRIVLNTTILDLLVIMFILHFVVSRYRESIVSIGISLKNFARNIFYGLAAYAAIIPILLAVLFIIAIFVNMFGYVPEKQAVVKLFLKEKNASLLLYTSIFAAILGPIVEEIFFRGFMYNAFKKRMGVFWSMVATSFMFAALHAHAVGFVPIMVLGMLLAYLYEKTGTIISSVTVHVVHNLAMVGLVFMVKQLGVW